MKRFAVLFTCFLLLMTMPGCGTAVYAPGNPDVTPPVSGEIAPTPSADDATPDAATTPDAPGDSIINIYCPYDPVIFDKFRELHPDFPYEINVKSFATVCTSYTVALDESLTAGRDDAPDIYVVESADIRKYAAGDMARYAAPYKDLGLDMDTLVKEADIARYVLDMGTNPDGEIVALSYEGTGGAFIYRRSIAKDVWGTDDPETIKDKIGPGWDKFPEAAAKLKARGYSIVSGYDDIWYAVLNSAEIPWIVDGKLTIDPRRTAFLDLAKQLHDKGYTNNTLSWTDDWYAGMKDAGPKKVFGYLGPSWFVDYVLKGNCGGEAIGEGTYGDWAVCEPPVGFFWGGEWIFANKNSPHKEALGVIIRWITLDTSETGLQYLWANGQIDRQGEQMAAVSGTVMRKVSAEMDILGYQDMFDVFDRAARLARGDNTTHRDVMINSYWLQQVGEYAEGRKTRAQAIADFKQEVKDNLNITVE